MYNLNFIVKYKQIEEDLIKKINAGENGYSKEDVYSICDELYRNELLAVFYMNEFNESKINTAVNHLWEELKEYPDFLIILDLYKTKTDQCNEYAFIEMFNYHLFYLIHPFITKILRNTNKEEIKINILSLQNIINNL